jgi:hypothetical protein
MTKNQFRLLTILCFASVVGAAAWDIAVPLPPALETFQASEAYPIDRLGLLGTIIMMVVLAIAILSFILLLIFHKLAPAFFVVSNVVAFAMSPLLGYGIYSPVSELLAAISTFCAGAMIPIMFMTDARTFFAKQAALSS